MVLLTLMTKFFFKQVEMCSDKDLSVTVENTLCNHLEMSYFLLELDHSHR